MWFPCTEAAFCVEQGLKPENYPIENKRFLTCVLQYHLENLLDKIHMYVNSVNKIKKPHLLLCSICYYRKSQRSNVYHM